MSDAEVVAAVALMGVITYLTRAGGVWLVGLVPATDKVERFLHHLSGSVLAALTVSVAFGGDAARIVGVAVACIAMLVTRSALVSLMVGTFIAAIARLAGVS